MKIKVAIRKLNRTLLKKESTNEIYVTGGILLSFFGYSNISELATSRRDPRSEKTFICKNASTNQKTIIPLRVTKENNEVRITGFEDYFEANHLNETDQLVFKCIDNGESVKYYLDYVKCSNTRVFQRYSPSDDCNNYSISYQKSDNGRDTIQITEIGNSTEQPPNKYWLWDDSFDSSRWKELIESPIDIIFVAKNNVKNKTIKIVNTATTFNKILKTKSRSSNTLESQEKDLYEILEFINDEWIAADFGSIRNLEILDEGNHLKITNRDALSFYLNEGGVI